MTPTEELLWRMLEARSSPRWVAEPYYYSYQYIADSRALRAWMRDNDIEQKFMLYGDQQVDGRLVKNGETI